MKNSVMRVLDGAVADGGVPGILAEIHHGQDRWFGTAGVADIETGARREAGHRFRIGSTTKTFVATVVLQLAGEGELSLDDTVATWLPGLIGDEITVRQLLNHTSGLFNYVLAPALIATYTGLAFLEHRFDSIKPERLVEIAMSHPADFAPGTAWGYSNTNYVVAGLLIERVTGASLADEISRRVLRPLGLTGTSVPVGDDASIAGPHSRHYSKLYLPDIDGRDVTELNPSWARGAGDMISTAADLGVFFRELLGGGLLKPAEQQEMFTTVATGDKWIPNTGYGLGVASVRLARGTEVWGMGGAIHGSWSYSFGTRDGSRLVVVNVNGDWAAGGRPDPIGVFTDLLEAEFASE
ncbi:D-alanyl-D-alanine carboxypeptidase [Amycolatopsis xylanica]|uniref:D-alanyl-D-alanine carboxypeptidase n=1 Tax=Amycolatopsis xylanica TaxID=589385 RepID=A0A1H2S8D7_9PSEU|nr:serine hydrolase domain-containing protein [Amycolatopsis xylanica]SDW27790.1 D-alanyl-D-alanine carboxypeptidase [Amycolatopsis xylanica]